VKCYNNRLEKKKVHNLSILGEEKLVIVKDIAE
jgi:hypothetical protein